MKKSNGNDFEYDATTKLYLSKREKNRLTFYKTNDYDYTNC